MNTHGEMPKGDVVPPGDDGRDAHLRRLAAVGALAPVFAHDLNNVLGSLLAGVHLLQMRISDPALTNRLTALADSANRAVAAAQSFSALAAEHGTLIDLHAMIEELARHPAPLTVELLARRAQTQGDAPALAAALTTLIALVARADGFTGSVRLATANCGFVSTAAGPEAEPGDIWLRLAITGDGAALSTDHRRILEAPLSVHPGDREGLLLGGAVAVVKRSHGAVVVPDGVAGIAIWVFLPIA